MELGGGRFFLIRRSTCVTPTWRLQCEAPQRGGAPNHPASLSRLSKACGHGRLPTAPCPEPCPPDVRRQSSGCGRRRLRRWREHAHCPRYPLLGFAPVQWPCVALARSEDRRVGKVWVSTWRVGVSECSEQEKQK